MKRKRTIGINEFFALLRGQMPLLATCLAVLLATAGVAVALAAPLFAGDWPQFRGPDRDAKSSATGLLPNTFNWMAAILGPIWSAMRGALGMFWGFLILEMIAWVQIQVLQTLSARDSLIADDLKGKRTLSADPSDMPSLQPRVA